MTAPAASRRVLEVPQPSHGRVACRGHECREPGTHLRFAHGMGSLTAARTAVVVGDRAQHEWFG
jgi:hypothetical protein